MNDRKKSLLEFQARLSERLREAASGVTPAARLGVLVGDRRMLVELSEAGEVVPMPASIAAVPLTRDWFRGLVNLRGALYAVSDLGQFAGGPPTSAGRDARLIAVAPRLGLNAAIAVARMLGLQSVETMRRVPHPDAADRPAWLGDDWQDEQGKLWTELSLADLVADERFLAVAR